MISLFLQEKSEILVLKASGKKLCFPGASIYTPPTPFCRPFATNPRNTRNAFAEFFSYLEKDTCDHSLHRDYDPVNYQPTAAPNRSTSKQMP
jgi:hypothetical protein